MGVSIRQLTPVFAGEVTGVDCSKPLSSDEVAAIHAGMNEYAVLVFRDQKLTDEEQLQFTLHFGVLENSRGGTPGHIHFRTDQEARKLGSGIVDFSNVEPSGKTLSRDSRAYMFKLADQMWHSDSSFKAIPASYSLLSGRSVVSWGGNTEFADMRAAYDALDDRLKQMIDGLVCLHSNMYSRGQARGHGIHRRRACRVQAGAPAAGAAPSGHRADIAVPVCACRRDRGHVDPGSADAAARPYRVRDKERFVYSHAWRVNDFVMWDNRSTMHRGRRFDPSEARDIRQTRLAGDGPTIAQDAA